MENGNIPLFLFIRATYLFILAKICIVDTEHNEKGMTKIKKGRNKSKNKMQIAITWNKIFDIYATYSFIRERERDERGMGKSKRTSEKTSFES